MASRKERADALTRIAIDYLWRNGGLVGTQIGIHGRTADVVSINWHNEIRIIEVKSCRSDFLADWKWWDYLRYSDYFYFAALPDTITVDDLPPGIGLIEPYKHERPIDMWRSSEIVKKPRRLKLIDEVDFDVRHMLLKAFAWQSQHTVHSFCPKCGRNCINVPASRATGARIY